jgi:hypothetical protein
MKVSFDKLMSAINTYIEHDLMPLSASMGKLEQFLFGVKMGIFKEKAGGAIMDFIQGSMAQTFKLVDENGNIDVDVFYNAAKNAMRPLSYIEVAGIRLNEADIDKIYSYLR